MRSTERNIGVDRQWQRVYFARAFCETFKIKQIYTTPYHPQKHVGAAELADVVIHCVRLAENKLSQLRIYKR